MNIEDLKKIANDERAFNDAFRDSWGRILKDFETHNVMPPKELLLKIQDAAIFPFLFKNYHLDDKEYSYLKSMVNRGINQNSVNSSLEESNNSKENKELSENDESVLEKMETGVSAIDFTVYENIVKALNDNSTVPYLEDSHNIALLNRLRDENVDFIKLIDEDSENNSWLSMVLLAASDREVGLMTQELICSVDVILANYAYGNNRASAIRKTPSYFKSLVNGYDHLYFSDFKGVAHTLSDDDLVKAFSKAWKNDRNDLAPSDERLSVYFDKDLATLAKNSPKFSEIKKIVNNKVVALWDASDFKENKIEFLNGFLRINKHYIMPNKNFIDALALSEPLTISDIYTKDDVLTIFNKLKVSEDIYERVDISFDESTFDSINLLTGLMSIAYPSDSAPMLKIINKIIEKFEHKYSYTGVQDALANLAMSVLNKGLVGDFNDKEMFLRIINKNDGKLFRWTDSASSIIENAFKPEEANFLNAFLLISCKVKLKEDKIDLYLNALHPNDLDMLREILPSFPDGIIGNVNARALKKEDLNGEFFDRDLNFLDSPKYVSLISQDDNVISSKSDFEEWLFALTRNDKMNVLPVIVKSLEKNPDFLPKEPRLLQLLENYPETMVFLPSKEYPSFDEYFKNINKIKSLEDEIRIIKEKSKSFDFSDLKLEIETLQNKNSIPTYLKEIYVSQAVKEKEWEKYASTSDLTFIFMKNILKEDLTVSDVKSLFNLFDKDNFRLGRCFRDMNADGIKEKEAALLLSSVKKNIDIESYILGYEDLIPLMKNDKARKIILNVMLEDFPELIVIPVFFNFTYELSDKERLTALKNGFAVADNKMKRQTFKSSSNEDKKTGIKESLSKELIEEIRKVDWSIEEKMVLNVTLEDSVKHYTANGHELLNFLKEKEYKVSQASEHYLKNNSDEVYNSWELSSGIFNEFLRNDFIDRNIEEIDLAIQSLDAKSRYSYNFTVVLPELGGFKQDYIDIGAPILKKIKTISIPHLIKNDFKQGLHDFLNIYPPENITNVIKITDENMNEILEHVKSGLKVKNSSDFSDRDSYKIFDKAVITMFSEVFTSNDVSPENKEAIVNIINMYSLSDKFISNDLLSHNGKRIFTNHNLVALSSVYDKRVKINNMFTNFDDKFLADESQDFNEFKL